MSEPSKTITLSDGSEWELAKHWQFLSFSPWHRVKPSDIDQRPDSEVTRTVPHRYQRGPLTASDHRKIADVLDPPADAALDDVFGASASVSSPAPPEPTS